MGNGNPAGSRSRITGSAAGPPVEAPMQTASALRVSGLGPDERRGASRGGSGSGGGGGA